MIHVLFLVTGAALLALTIFWAKRARASGATAVRQSQAVGFVWSVFCWNSFTMPPIHGGINTFALLLLAAGGRWLRALWMSPGPTIGQTPESTGSNGG